MGKMILCSGKRTDKPYIFAATGTRIYSMEELCRYLYEHFYLIDRSIFLPSLIEWISLELELKDRADKLKQLIDKKADLKTIVTVILCSSDYYSETEIKALLKLIDEIEGMPKVKRNCVRAKHMLGSGLYFEAAKEYDQIINSKDAAEISPREYGDILHNLAVAKVYITGPEEASEIFRLAYEHNQNEKSLVQYLYTLRLSSREELFQEKLKEYQVKPELLQDMNRYMERIEEEALHSKGMMEIRQLRKWKSEGKITRYQNRVEEILENWKSSVRMG